MGYTVKDTNDKMKLQSFAGSERDFADPWYTGNFDQTYADILEGCTPLLKKPFARINLSSVALRRGILVSSLTHQMSNSVN